MPDNDVAAMTDSRLMIAIRLMLVPSVLLMALGCTSLKHRAYAPLVRDLDGLNELEISTYPADFADRLGEKGDILQKYESAGQLYFQVFIRDAKNKTGPNPHVQSITIHAFSYQMGDEPPTVMLSEYKDNFWMQGNPRYDERGLPPIPYEADGSVFVKISLTLNDTKYEFEGEMPATEKTTFAPTFIVEQGI
jgi:hypothetical protein